MIAIDIIPLQFPTNHKTGPREMLLPDKPDWFRKHRKIPMVGHYPKIMLSRYTVNRQSPDQLIKDHFRTGPTNYGHFAPSAHI